MSDESPNEAEESMIDEYLDCCGKTRRFRLSLYAHGLFLEAVELRENDDFGFRFIMPVKPDEVPPWGTMRDLIRERLSQRDIVRSEKTKKLELLRRTIRAQIDEDDSDDTPMLLVDDMRISWRELGRLLRSFNGWGLRIQICDAGEE